MAYLETLRIGLLKLADRLVGKDGLDAQEDIFNLTLDEHVATDIGTLPRRLAAQRTRERRRQLNGWAAAQELDIIIEHGEVSITATVPVVLAADARSGTAVGAGSIQGLARLVGHAAVGIALQVGDILAAPSTDPAWTPLLLKAGAVVMETGGYLSHDTIVVREFGISAVANVSGIQVQLKDGETIHVDGSIGMVSRVVGQPPRCGDEATLANASYCGTISGLTFRYFLIGLSLNQSSEGITMNTAAFKAAPALRFARFWQIVRRETSHAVALHVESCGMMVELYRRSGR